ncbi:Formate--tetrahydrofolate ligase [Gossypium australe]|uniref:Formate--tetrahydrofolate ligase n=1 Tax=Gossypium australe TaxID=47621 RepID=A0A5B6V1E2_9ROSI|nr:Formate--tetrahydrofolate ligase [Gossypium australe]
MFLFHPFRATLCLICLLVAVSVELSNNNIVNFPSCRFGLYGLSVPHESLFKMVDISSYNEQVPFYSTIGYKSDLEPYSYLVDIEPFENKEKPLDLVGLKAEGKSERSLA